MRFLVCILLAALLQMPCPSARADTLAEFLASYRADVARGDLASAFSTIAAAIRSEEERRGRDDPVLLPLRRDQAVVLGAQGDLAGALAELEQLRSDAVRLGASSYVIGLDLDIASVLAELGRADEARMAYEQAASVERSLPPSLPTKGGPGSVSAAGIMSRRFMGSRWDLYNRGYPELEGYGRYSYVLYLSPPAADDPFLAELFGKQVLQAWAGEPPIDLNLFYVPVSAQLVRKVRIQGQESVEPPAVTPDQVAREYDIRMAQATLRDFCSWANPAPDACTKPNFDAGPYVLVLPAPLSRYRPGATGTAMLLNLSGHRTQVTEAAFKAMLAVAQDRSSDGMTRVATTKLMVADALVGSGGLAVAMVQAMAQLSPFRAK